MTNNENTKKTTGHFDPHELQTIRELVDPQNPGHGIELAAQRLNRDAQSVTTKYYKLRRGDAETSKKKNHQPQPPTQERKNLTHSPIENKRGESLALQGIRALTPKLGREERISAIEALVEM